jgi:CRP-like cAMP-binding protein
MSEGLMLSHQDNRLLATLPREVFGLLGGDLRQISHAQGETIYEPGEQIEKIYFPQSGMISLLVVTGDGRAIETATIGREGAVGLHSALGKRLSFTRAMIQIPGKSSVISAAAFAKFADNYAPVRDLIARYTELLWAGAQQLAACNAAHDGSARLCRFLLQSADCVGSDYLPLTQEFVAEMLGVRRTTATLFAQSLKRRGLIRYSRGRITILNREQLERCACECYAVMRQEKLLLKADRIRNIADEGSVG